MKLNQDKYLMYENDHFFINLDQVESWLVPSLSLDIVTPPVLIKDLSLYNCL
jgi:hypothetical protein